MVSQRCLTGRRVLLWSFDKADCLLFVAFENRERKSRILWRVVTRFIWGFFVDFYLSQRLRLGCAQINVLAAVDDVALDALT